jgi:hypothetical protein
VFSLDEYNLCDYVWFVLSTSTASIRSSVLKSVLVLKSLPRNFSSSNQPLEVAVSVLKSRINDVVRAFSRYHKPVYSFSCR